MRDLVLADLEQIASAAQHARRRAADDDVGFRTDGLEQKLRIERRDFEHADIGHAEQAADRLDGGTAQPALLLLGTPQDQDHGGLLPAGRIAGDDFLGPRLVLGRERKARGLDVIGGKTADGH